MEQLEFFEIPSPCIGVCQSDARGYCKGCLRNRNERFNWLEFSDAQKYDVIRLCKQRKRRRQLARLKAKKALLLDERARVNTSLDFGQKSTIVPGDDVDDFKLD
ncbi:DUF1289 domain-containing protein [Shewanella schlegeliana]|uniref:DUF1289 domain-containing protein n=1 Tax=Shewanella schlegeliana TaxID=190308 RepID=A0ABS1SYH3_9GAMM|nr:DUF1289 domain-containing protein [Shewanella schlegeliana]MBL4912336.1 DUF1289 domain-containing protein [Shewanella schlegeliana]MCL1108195.1 DUF1289 domain-containing protein [Shewanella schlegeliana]GIU22144.1 DUF1289 domain-containing protein [Shewanella schlegeliana]